jgi:DNA-binding LacI/PurR family transcriptional regulator
VQLESERGIPRNPFINAGAIAVTDRLVSLFDAKAEMLSLLSSLCGDPVSFDEEVAASEAARHVGAAIDAGVEFDALVCRDDLAAIGALRAAQERGLRVPHDIAITGWDDIAMSAVTYPSITTIAPDMEFLVRRALELLVERIEGYDGMGRHVIAPHRLVVRESAPVEN